MQRMRNLRGFTLIELIVVILILGILAAIAVVGYTQVTDKAKETAELANAKQIVSALSADATLAGVNVDAYLDALGADDAAVTTALTDRFGFPVSYVGDTTDEVTVGATVIDVSKAVAQIK